MCVLCGELIMHVHWTDQPVHNDVYKSTIVVGEGQRERMRLRLKRVKFSSKILSYYGLSIRDWSGSRYILADKKGNSKVVYDLGDMWRQASELAHKQLDPLDENFLNFFEKQAGEHA